ncbi:S-layer homology domain-containing protein [Paenibacillus tarimensis]
MRKKLSMLLVIALLLSLFTQLAYAEEDETSEGSEAEEVVEEEAEEDTAVSAKTSADFTDLSGLTEEEKQIVDLLLEKGIFNGVTEDTFGLDQNMNRAQFAKVAALIFSLEVDDTLEESSFEDVLADSGYGYALPFIEALRDAGLTSGYDPQGRTYNPGGEVSREQLAAFLIRGLGLEDEALVTDPIQDDSVSPWARRYVALALQKNILANQNDGKFGGKAAATRKMLVLASYSAIQLNKVSIVEAKQTASSEVTVTFNTVVDSAAELHIAKNGVQLAGFTDWSDDGKSATVVLEQKLRNGTYQAVLTGLDEETVTVGTLDFTGEDEKVSTIEIASPSNTLPKSKVRIGVKAENQFGESKKLGASELLINASLNKSVDFETSSQSLILDLSDQPTNANIVVTVIHRASSASASKTFTVGDIPLVSKIELGELKLPGGQTLFKAGGNAYLSLKAFDQSGNPVTDPKALHMGILKMYIGENVLRESSEQNDFIDFDKDGYPELQLTANTRLSGDKEVEVRLIAIGSGQNAVTTIKVIAPKTPASVEFYDFKDQLATGDGSSFIEIIVKDSSGYQLTQDEIVDAETTGKLWVFSTGGVTIAADPPTRIDTSVTPHAVRNVAIQATGGDKGKIRISGVNGWGPATVNVRLTALNKVETLHVNIRDARKPDSIAIANGDNPVLHTKHYMLVPGAKEGPTFRVLDQYGNDYKQKQDHIKVQVKLEKMSGDSGAVKTTGSAGVRLSDEDPVVLKDINNISTRSIDFQADQTLKGTYRLTAALVEVNSSDVVIREMDSASATVEVIDPATAGLTYYLDIEDELLAVGRLLYNSGKAPSVTDATYLFTHQDEYKMFYQNIEIRARNGADEQVKLANTVQIRSVSSNAPNVIGSNNIDKVIGLDSGTATVTVVFDSPEGTKKVSADVTVKEERLYVKELKNGRTSYTVPDGGTVDLNGLYIWDKKLMNQLQAIDQYNNQFTNTGTQDQISMYNNMLNVTAFISDIKYVDGTDPSERDVVYIGPDFKVNYTRKGSDPTKNNIKQFTIYTTGADQLKPCLITLQ